MNGSRKEEKKNLCIFSEEEVIPCVHHFFFLLSQFYVFQSVYRIVSVFVLNDCAHENDDFILDHQNQQTNTDFLNETTKLKIIE